MSLRDLAKEMLLTIGAGLLALVAIAVVGGGVILACARWGALWVLGVPAALYALFIVGAEARWAWTQAEMSTRALEAIWGYERKAKREGQAHD